MKVVHYILMGKLLKFKKATYKQQILKYLSNIN